MTTATTILATLLLSTTLPTIARAEADAPALTATTVRDLALDLEVDPTAYVMSGYSVHAGIGWKRFRVDLGTFAMDLPEFLHGNEGFEASFAGAGVKLQYFPLAAQRGLFVDVGLGVTRREVTLVETGTTRRDTAASIGASIGYRFTLPHGFYATPWIGANVDLEDGHLMVDGRTFSTPSVTPFAAIHLGYRFR